MQALTHLSLHVQLATDGARPCHVSASASKKSSGKLQFTRSDTLCKNDSFVLKQSAAEHHRRSLREQTELKGWMAST